VTLSAPASNAVDLAAAHCAANAAAMGLTLALPNADWVFARDGALTTRDAGQWLGGCSVPRRAAEVMTRNLTSRGRSIAMLLPTHAQQIVATLHKIDPTVAVIAMLSEAAALPTMLGCCDFSADIRSGRLHFAWDESSMQNVFDQQPGLAVPQQFIRLPVTDEAKAAGPIAWAQRVFNVVVAQHRARLTAARSSWKPAARAVVLAGQQFTLWNDAGVALSQVAGVDAIDLDHPLHAAAAWVAEQTQNAAAVITANFGRADDASADPASVDQPWITWITRPRVPAFAASSPRDLLLLADEDFRSLACAAGWPSENMRSGSWPVIKPTAPLHPVLAIIVDLPDLSPPAEVNDFSSWRVVWEAVASELRQHPQRLGSDSTAYLDAVRQRCGAAKENFPQTLFIERLIAPMYAVGVAVWLAREGLPIALHGHGWDAFDSLAPHWHGPICSADQLQSAISAAGVIDPFLTAAHPIRGVRVPVVRTLGKTPGRVLQDCRAALAGKLSLSTAKNTIVDFDWQRELIQNVGR
jgi:hypothetical protein